MVKYTRIDCKLTNVQLNKIKKAVKNGEEITLRLGMKNYEKRMTYLRSYFRQLGKVLN